MPACANPTAIDGQLAESNTAVAVESFSVPREKASRHLSLTCILAAGFT
jgi:hypothetical protein